MPCPSPWSRRSPGCAEASLRRRAPPLLVLGALALAAGCATDARRDGLSTHEFGSVNHMAVHMAGDPPAHAYQVLDRIQGVSCNRAAVPRSHPEYKVVTRYEALYDMKLEAADLGANALIGVSCRSNTLTSDCYSSIVCSGEAVRLDDGVGMDLPLASMSSLQAKAAGTDFTTDTSIYRSPLGFTPDYLTEPQRAGLGRLGLAVQPRAPGRTVEAPPSGDDAMYQGAGLWFVQCAAQGGTIGLLVSPLCAAIGAGLGALSAESEEGVTTSRFAIRAALEEAYSHDALSERVVLAAAQSGAPPLTRQAAPRPGDAVRRRGHPWRFEPPVDSIIEIGVEEMWLPAWRSGATTNLPVPVSVRARARVIRVQGSDEIYNRSYRFVSQRRLFRQWGADGGAALRHALETGFEQIAEQIVEDLLIAYPLMPGFAFTATRDGRRNYVVEPVSPPVHQYWQAGSIQAARVTTLEPEFRWRAFPGEAALNADFQGKLRRAQGVRYDLRIYRLDEARATARMVLEHNDIHATDFRLSQPLAPGTDYAWSVRARFALNTGDRATRWSGDWVGGGVKGFLFRTPD